MAECPTPRLDPVNILFRKLPTVQWYIRDGFQACEERIKSLLERFVACCDKMQETDQDFIDPDTSFLHDKFGFAIIFLDRNDMCYVGLLFPILAELALQYADTPRKVLPNGGVKSHQLRLALWIMRGRRDNENPFNIGYNPETASLPFNHFSDLNTQTAKDDKYVYCTSCKTRCGPQYCNGCLVDEKWVFLGVAYCSRKCQKEHWKEHKVICETRQELVVAVAQLRALSQLFQSRTCDQTYKIAEVKGAPHGAIVLRQNAGLSLVAPAWPIPPEAFKGEFVFREPARGVLGSEPGRSEDYDNAIVHHGRSSEHSGVELWLVKKILKPLCKSINTMSLEPKNLAIVITEKSMQGVLEATTSLLHEVLLVKLHSEEEFIIDLSGAQYGWHETLSLAIDYKIARCGRVMETAPPGMLGKYTDSLRLFRVPEEVGKVSRKLKKEVIKVMNDKVQRLTDQRLQRKEAPLTPSTVLEFLPRLLSVVESAIDDRLNSYKALDMYRLFVHRIFRCAFVQATTSAEHGQTLRETWLTEEEYDPIKDDVDELMKLWMVRVARSSGEGDNEV